MADSKQVVDRYIEMWNETDPQRRRELVAQTVTEDARYLEQELGDRCGPTFAQQAVRLPAPSSSSPATGSRWWRDPTPTTTGCGSPGRSPPTTAIRPRPGPIS